MRRSDPAIGSALLTMAVIVMGGMLLSLVTVVPSGNATVAGDSRVANDTDAQDLEELDEFSAGEDDIAGSVDGQSGTPGPGAGGGGELPPEAKASCAAGRNDGATDVGVTANEVKLAATVVADGPGASFLSPVRTGMVAVVNRANAKPEGICGRRIRLILRNDSWDASRGQQFIKNFVESENVFALAVVPSSEGLRAADSYIRTKKVPVIGSDGMLIHQYRNPWIWPVATSTISTMHIMAKNAHDRGAREFGIVFDAKYHFGVEGAFAFNEAVKRLTGNAIPGYDPNKKCLQRFCGIQPQKPSYASDASTFNNACFHQGSSTCDFIAYLLEPDTAVSFFHEGRPADPKIGLGGGQPLFTKSFAENCQRLCNGMWVWTGYNPPIEALAATSAVASFVADIRKESGSADVTNQFLEGGYLGMSLVVAAIEKTGPRLTRDGIRKVLDNLTFDIGLSSPLTWRPDNHFANTAAQAFEIQYQQSFTGWRQKTGFIVDPWVGQDIPAGE